MENVHNTTQHTTGSYLLESLQSVSEMLNPVVVKQRFVFPVTPPRLQRAHTEKGVKSQTELFGKTSRSQMFSAECRGQKGETAANSQFNPSHAD